MASSRHCFIAFFRIPHSTLPQILHTTFRFQILIGGLYIPQSIWKQPFMKKKMGGGGDVTRVLDGRFENKEYKS